MPMKPRAGGGGGCRLVERGEREKNGRGGGCRMEERGEREEREEREEQEEREQNGKRGVCSSSVLIYKIKEH